MLQIKTGLNRPDRLSSSITSDDPNYCVSTLKVCPADHLCVCVFVHVCVSRADGTTGVQDYRNRSFRWLCTKQAGKQKRRGCVMFLSAAMFISTAVIC